MGRDNRARRRMAGTEINSRLVTRATKLGGDYLFLANGRAGGITWSPHPLRGMAELIADHAECQYLWRTVNNDRPVDLGQT